MAEQPMEAGVIPEEGNAAPIPEVGKVATVEAGKEGAAASANPEPVVQPAPQVDYVAKYKELQRAYTQETQKRSTLEKQWSGIDRRMEEQAKMLAEMRKQPYDREKFLAEFQEKGPEVLRPLWSEDIDKVKAEHSKQLDDYKGQISKLHTDQVLMARRYDSENYPDFKKLEPTISQMIDDPTCPVDFSKPMEQVIDALYQLARQTNSAEAIREAEISGQKKAEERLVKESKATVTGGGKAASITKPDLSKMSVTDLRKYYVDLNGEVERD